MLYQFLIRTRMNSFYLLYISSFQRYNEAGNNALCQCTPSYQISFQTRSINRYSPSLLLSFNGVESSREPSNRRYSSISNSTMWDLENDRQEGEREDRSDISLNDNGSRTVGYIKLVTTFASFLFRKNATSPHKYLFTLLTIISYANYTLT